MRVLILPEDRFADLLRLAYNEGVLETGVDDIKRAGVVTKLMMQAVEWNESSGLHVATPDEVRARETATS